MMGRLKQDQGQLFYSFNLDEAVPDDHLVRKIGAVLDLCWVHDELASHYSAIGRPSIDPVLMIRMLILGYVFAIRSERALQSTPLDEPRRRRWRMRGQSTRSVNRAAHGKAAHAARTGVQAR
jgi:hypothetical protein